MVCIVMLSQSGTSLHERIISSGCLTLRNRLRLLSYVASIPCLFVAAITAWRLIQAQNRARQSHHRYRNGSNVFSLPPLSQEVPQPLEYATYQSEPDIHDNSSPAAWSSLFTSTSQVTDRVELGAELSARQFHLLSASQTRLSGSEFAIAKVDDLYEPSTPTSFMSLKFASPSQASGMNGPWASACPDDRERREGECDAGNLNTWARAKDPALIVAGKGKGFDGHHLNTAWLGRNGNSSCLLK
jgi:hypothetical protein